MRLVWLSAAFILGVGLSIGLLHRYVPASSRLLRHLCWSSRLPFGRLFLVCSVTAASRLLRKVMPRVRCAGAVITLATAGAPPVFHSCLRKSVHIYMRAHMHAQVMCCGLLIVQESTRRRATSRILSRTSILSVSHFFYVFVRCAHSRLQWPGRVHSAGGQ